MIKLLPLFLYLLLSFAAPAQSNQTFEYGLIHYDLRNTTIEVYLGKAEKVEHKADKRTYLVQLQTLLNDLGSQGWEIKSTDAYQSLVWGTTPTNAVIIYLCRVK